MLIGRRTKGRFGHGTFQRWDVSAIRRFGEMIFRTRAETPRLALPLSHTFILTQLAHTSTYSSPGKIQHFRASCQKNQLSPKRQTSAVVTEKLYRQTNGCQNVPSPNQHSAAVTETSHHQTGSLRSVPSPNRSSPKVPLPNRRYQID